MSLSVAFLVFVTSRSSIYLATTAATTAATASTTNQSNGELANDPLYQNAAGRDDDVSTMNNNCGDETKSKTTKSQTVCRSVSFLQKKSYQECFNSSAIESKINQSTTTDAEDHQLTETREPEEAEMVVKTTDGVEWEFQDLSLYLGSLCFERILILSPEIFVAN